MFKNRKYYIFFKYLILIPPVLWLIYSACNLDIEYFDGYDAILNSYYFSGDSSLYIAYKAPLMGLLLVPAHILNLLFSFSPLDLQIYHFEMALIHILYLIAIFLLLEKREGKNCAVALAFAASIPNFVFFSYAPFINIDIYPGLIFIVMIISADKFTNNMNTKYWLSLVISGVIASLIKPTYGIFWFAIICAYILMFSPGLSREKKKRQILMFLIAGAFLSLVLYWIIMCFVMKNNFPMVIWILKPWEQIRTMTVANDQQGFFPWWIYLRNFPFYGIITTLLIIPGLILGFRSKNTFNQLNAICWIISFIILHLFFLREVRYIAFLAPLSAFIIIAPVKYIIEKKPFYLFPIILILMVDLFFSAKEAFRITGDFYQKSQLKSFLAALTDSGTHDLKHESSFIMNNFLCFIPPGEKTFAGDRFHRKFHFGPYHLKVLYCPRQSIRWQENSPEINNLLSYDPASFLIYSNFLPVNSDNIMGNSKDLFINYVLLTAKSTNLDMISKECEIFRNNSSGNLCIRSPFTGKVFQSYIFPVLFDADNHKIYHISQTPDGNFEIENSKSLNLEFPKENQFKFKAYKIIGYIFVNLKNGTEFVPIPETQ